MKPGYQTSEFLLALAGTIGVILFCLFDRIGGDAAVAALSAISVGYSASRGVAKINPPKDAGGPVD